MLKKIITIQLTILLSACGFMWSDEGEDMRICPNVLISRADAYLVQKDLQHENFLIELIGFDGYCFFDKRINHDKAVITPIFRIKRLRPTDETDVMFSYYTETVKGPPAYLGKKTHYAKAKIPLDKVTTEYKGEQAEVRIPPEMKYEYDINLGINIPKTEKKYNQRTFDVPLEYEE